MNKRIIIFIIILTLFFTTSIYALNVLYWGLRSNWSAADLAITQWPWNGKSVKNPTNIDYFIPNETQIEWDAFVSAAPRLWLEIVDSCKPWWFFISRHVDAGYCPPTYEGYSLDVRKPNNWLPWKNCLRDFNNDWRSHFCFYWGVLPNNWSCKNWKYIFANIWHVLTPEKFIWFWEGICRTI